MGAPTAHAQTCGEAPNPERPGAGMVGAIDPPVGNGLPGLAVPRATATRAWSGTPTRRKCTVLPDATATLDTWAGNELFNIGKNIVGATNALHYTVMGRGLLVPLDDAVKNGVQKVYDNVYLRWFGLVALILAILMFRQIWTGDFAAISKRGLWALAAMWLATSTLALPQFYNLLDNTLVSKTSEIQAGFVEAPEEQGTLHVLPTKLHDAVVYQNWLRGEFGTPDAPQAARVRRRAPQRAGVDDRPRSPSTRTATRRRWTRRRPSTRHLRGAARHREGLLRRRRRQPHRRRVPRRCCSRSRTRCSSCSRRPRCCWPSCCCASSRWPGR